MLTALDREQREQLYSLLRLATAESAAACLAGDANLGASPGRDHP